MASRLAFVIVCTLAACGPDHGSDSSGTDTASTSAAASSSDSTVTAPTTVAPPDGDPCECYNEGCGSKLCETPALACELENCEADLWWHIDGEEHLECLLMALRDRKPGLIEWSRTHSFDAGADETRIFLKILVDGTVRRNPTYPNSCRLGPDTHSTLKDPSYFAGCLAETDALARFLCMDDAFVADLAECAPSRPIDCPPDPEPF